MSDDCRLNFQSLEGLARAFECSDFHEIGIPRNWLHGHVLGGGGGGDEGPIVFLVRSTF